MRSAAEPVTDPAALRRSLRQQRRALRPAEQRAAARRLCRNVTRRPEFLRARRIALYVAADGEIDPAGIRRAAWRLGKQVFLPVLHRCQQGHLRFAACRPGARLLPNRFGIPEPATLKHCVRPWQLDLVLLPLVAFDEAGNRLGMGGGYYDRTFSADALSRWPRKPRLMGLAHGFQRVARLTANAWDVPLERVFTDGRDR